MPYPTFPVSNVHSISLLGSLNDSFVVVVMVVGGGIGRASDSPYYSLWVC